MAHPKVVFHKLVDSFSHLLDIANIESQAARKMAFFEIFLGVFLLAGLAALYFHEIFLAITAAVAGDEVHADGVAFYLFAFAMIVSVVIVVVQDALGR